MKKLNTTVIILALLCSLLYAKRAKAQEATGTPSLIFEINPMGTDILNRKVKFGSTFKFRITHVNSFKLNGYSTAKPFNYETAAPSVFADTKLPGLPDGTKATAGDGIISLPTYAGALESFTLRAGRSNKNGRAAKQLADAQTKLAKAQNKLAALNEQLNNDFANNYNDFADGYHNLQKYTVAEDSLYKMLPDIIIPDPEGLRENATSYMISVYHTSDKDKFADVLTLTLRDINKHYIALKKAYEALNKTGISDVSDITGPLKNQSGSITITITKATATIKNDPKFLDQYTAATKIFNDINTADTQSKLFNKAFKGIGLYRMIDKDNAFTVYTDGQQITDDETQITPSLKNNKGIIVKEFNPVTINAYGGIKVNFSTGYLLTFRGDNNYAYYSEGSPSKIAGVVKQKSNSLTNSIGALAHVYRRSAQGAAAGLSGGFSLTNNGNIGFYLGGSGLFLEKSRLAITAGLSYVKVNVLNTGNLNKVENTNPQKYTFNSKETKINYDSLYKPGFFIGITYNLFSAASAVKAK